MKLNLSRKEKKIVHGVLAVLFVIVCWFGYTCFFEKVCYSATIERFVRHDVTIIAPQGAIVSEVADTRASRELGLSGRKGLRNNEGLLFVFDAPGRYGFWMKDMLFPIDILWINQNGIVVKTESLVTPESYPQTYINDAEALYVLELSAGRAVQLGLFLGSKIKIEQ